MLLLLYQQAAAGGATFSSSSRSRYRPCRLKKEKKKEITPTTTTTPRSGVLHEHNQVHINNESTNRNVAWMISVVPKPYREEEVFGRALKGTCPGSDDYFIVSPVTTRGRAVNQADISFDDPVLKSSLVGFANSDTVVKVVTKAHHHPFHKVSVFSDVNLHPPTTWRLRFFPERLSECDAGGKQCDTGKG